MEQRQSETDARLTSDSAKHSVESSKDIEQEKTDSVDSVKTETNVQNSENMSGEMSESSVKNEIQNDSKRGTGTKGEEDEDPELTR